MAHKRKAILCELNADYAELVEGRVAWDLSYYGLDPNAEEQLSLLEALA